MKESWSLLFSISCCALSNSIVSTPALAQVSADGTTNTTVSGDGNGNFTIEQGDRAGNNLFHSFGNFSVPTNGSAFFNNASDVSNIFSRVTGGNISNIDGLIQANGSANLFLINPAGILFGNNAQLDIGGSFLGTTADSILFEDGVFSATDLDNPPLLTVNAPIGLNFRDNPGDIVVKGDGQGTRTTSDVIDTENALRVNSDETFALAGGNLIFEGATIKTAGGRIELGSFEGNEQVNLTPVDEGFSLSDEGVQGFRDIQLSQTATIDASGVGGGNIHLKGQNITLTQGSQIESSTLTTSFSEAEVKIVALDSLNISGSKLLDSGSSANSGIFANAEVNSEATGQGGNVIVNTRQINLINGGRISVPTKGKGDAGNLSIVADDINIDGGENGLLTGLFASVNLEATGQGGNITIGSEQSPVKNVSISNGAQIVANTFGEGDAGNLSVFANKIDINGRGDFFSGLFAQVGENATGTGGNINLGSEQSPLEQLNLTNGGRISVSTSGQGNAGNLSIFSKNIEFDGGVDSLLTGLFASVASGATGQGGNITIGSEEFPIQQLIFKNRSQIVANTFSEGDAGNLSIFAKNIELDGGGDFLSGFFASVGSEATGQGGNIFIETDSLTLTDGGRIAANVETMGQGNAGTLKIFASENILINGTTSEGAPSAITSVVNGGLGSVEGIGDGGDVTIITGSLSLINGGRVSATSLGQGDGGDLTINASESIFISGFGQRFRSGISVSAFISDGDSGNANINTNQLTIENAGTIEASNIDTLNFFEDGTGQPGNINIQANSITLNNEGRIEAATQSETGNGANINLQVADNITLENNSFISAQAFGNANGGNLTIDANFIIGFPNETPGNGSDIIASAVEGDGGNINITAESLLGISEAKAIEGNGTNDIDASSDFGLDGTISIFTPDINPIQGATELPSNIVAPDQAVAQACNNNRGVRTASNFVIDGKGGIPPLPDAPMNSETITVNGATTANLNQGYAISTGIGDITPARGVIKRPDGSIVLTATPVTGSSSRVPNGSHCS